MMRALIIAEHDGTTLDRNLENSAACADAIGVDETVALILSSAAAPLAAQASRLSGIDRVLACDHPAFAPYDAAAWAAQIATLAESFTHVLGPSNTFGRDLMPRVAGLLGVGQLSDVSRVLGPHRFERAAYAGNAILTLEARDDVLVLATIRASSFPAMGERRTDAAPVEAIPAASELPAHTRVLQRSTGSNLGPELQTAARVVAGGRGIGSGEAFDLVRELAQAFGAAAGASRAAVDAGYVTNDLQIGQTGKIIAPDLYVALGISGAIQHVTGIRDARTIVAINNDAEAPIFDVADIGLVGDLFEVVPELLRALRAAAER